MKRVRFIAALLLALPLSIASADTPRGYPQLPERVFAPLGFDDNDNSQVVLYGYFPDSCYQAGPATASVEGMEIRITNLASRKDSGDCVRASNPWATTVDIGVLPPGTYKVSVMIEPDRFIQYAQLIVSSAVSSRQDDFLYAHVDGAIVEHVRPDADPILTIAGSFSMTCMEIQRIETHRSRDVIVVLPIVKLNRLKPCGYPFVPIPFTERLQLHPKTSEPTLIHIRSVNGQSVNRVIL
jgi:hypothetical protein